MLSPMSEFRFRHPKNLAVFVCDNVRLRGMPILHVSHDEDGDWQFLCGREHPEGGDDRAAVVCLEDVVGGDESLNELAELCPLRQATREAPGGQWEIYDKMEDIVRENVVEHACHVMMVSGGDEGYGFAYSIGLGKSFGQPEVVCFGLDLNVMHFMINGVRDRMEQGSRFDDGDRVAGLIEGYDCVFRRMQRTKYRDYLGYALWFYGGDGFDVLQLVWPDKERRFPWNDGYSAPPEQQPATW